MHLILWSGARNQSPAAKYHSLLPSEYEVRKPAAAPSRKEKNHRLEENVVPIATMEKRAIIMALRQTNGDKIMAARLLGIGKTTLYRKLKEYSVHLPAN